jgi:hypothetical protein
MTVTTYGQHSENAARALSHLVRQDELPVDPDAVAQLLGCRNVAVDALRQRLFDLGYDRDIRASGRSRSTNAATSLVGLDANLGMLVRDIAFALPRTHDDQQPVADALTAASSDQTVQSWQTSAIEMLSASHALSAAEEQPWLTDPGAGWWVLRDIAVALEAIVVLDGRLTEVGLLAGLHDSPDELTLSEKRTVLSQAARLATWNAVSASPEDATPRLTPRRTTVAHPVAMVSAPTDLAAAQRRLAQFLRPLSASDAFYTGQPEISADCARQITSSQLGLCRSFAKAAMRAARTSDFQAFFAERAEILQSLIPHLTHLVDLRTDREPDMRRHWQQVELTTAVARMESRGAPIRLEPHQFAELAEATHKITHQLGRVLRRELLRTNSNLADAHPRHVNGPVAVKRRSQLETTATDLVNLPAPVSRLDQLDVALQRSALRRTLDQSPSASMRAPAPLPVGRTAAPNAAVR